MEVIFDILSFLSPLSLSIGLVMGIIFFSNSDSKSKVLLVYFIISLIIDILNRYWGYILESHYNLFLIPVLGLLEIIVFSILYFYFFCSYKKILTFIIVICTAILFRDIFSALNFNPGEYTTYGKVFVNFAIIVYSLISITIMIKEPEQKTRSFQLFNYGVLIYFSINLLVMLPVNFLVNAPMGYVLAFWFLNLIITILFYSLLVYLLWQNGKTRKQLLYG